MFKDSLIGMVIAIMGVPLLLGAPPLGLALIAIGVGLQIHARSRYCIALQEAEEQDLERQDRELVLAFKALP